MAATTTLTHVIDARTGRDHLEFPRLVLESTKGPTGRRQKTFTTERVTIGSGEGAGFKLDDATVSALHCELRVVEEGIRVVDLHSKNGVWLGGRRVFEALLEPDDVLVLGASSVRVRAGESMKRDVSARTELGGLLGSSLAMRMLFDWIERVAPTDTSVLITGETGTGKELVAEALVSLSPRARQPLVMVDCAAQTDELFGAALFGHEKGAFTNAAGGIGAFERANGGTVLLDSVGELPLALQPHLLGVLERRVVQPIGGAPRPVDVRVIATSQRSLEREVNGGRFRADLYFRLAGVQLVVPPLEERAADIPLLVAHFCREFGLKKPLPASVLERLFAGHYPGNVRELKNAVARAAVGVMPKVTGRAGAEPSTDEPWWPQRERALAGLEFNYLTRLLEDCDGNMSEAARRSEISRVQLYALATRHGLGGKRR